MFVNNDACYVQNHSETGDFEEQTEKNAVGKVISANEADICPALNSAERISRKNKARIYFTRFMPGPCHRRSFYVLFEGASEIIFAFPVRDLI